VRLEKQRGSDLNHFRIELLVLANGSYNSLNCLGVHQWGGGVVLCQAVEQRRLPNVGWVAAVHKGSVGHDTPADGLRVIHRWLPLVEAAQPLLELPGPRRAWVQSCVIIFGHGILCRVLAVGLRKAKVELLVTRIVFDRVG
jgi:hypothetical protein